MALKSVKIKQAKNGVTHAKIHQDLIPNLIVVAASPRNGILNQSVWNFPGSSSEVRPDKNPWSSSNLS